MSAFVVVLKSNKLVAAQSRWVQDPTLHAETLVYFSPILDGLPNFQAPLKYFFDPQMTACYEARVLEQFGKLKCLF